MPAIEYSEQFRASLAEAAVNSIIHDEQNRKFLVQNSPFGAQADGTVAKVAIPMFQTIEPLTMQRSTEFSVAKVSAEKSEKTGKRRGRKPKVDGEIDSDAAPEFSDQDAMHIASVLFNSR